MFRFESFRPFTPALPPPHLLRVLQSTHGVTEVIVGHLLREACYHSNVSLETDVQKLVHLEGDIVSFHNMFDVGKSEH